MKGESFPSVYSFRVIDKQSHVHWVNISAVLFSWEKRPATLNLFSDITKQKQAEERYATLFNFSPDAIAEVDENTKILAANPAMAKNFGVDVEGLVGEFFSKFLPKKVYESRRKIGRKCLDENKIQQFEDERHGRYFYTTFVPIPSEDGGKSIQIISRDITEQKKAEKTLQNSHDELEKRVKQRTAELTETYEKLQESEKKYRLLFNVSPIGIGLVDVEGNILDGNPTMEEMAGYSIDELRSEGLGNTYVNLDDYKRLVKELQKKGRVHDWEIKLKNKEGEIYYALLDVEKIELSGRKGYIAIQRDISKQKADEQEIIRTKNRLQNVINSASEAIIAIDGNNNVSTWNRTAENITRYKQKQIVGKNLAKLKVFDRPRELEEYLKNVYVGYAGGLNLILRTRLGSKRVFRVRGSIIEEGGQLQGVILIGRDVTEDSEAHGKLLLGDSYLLTDENIKPSLDLFVGLITSEYDGLLITRDRPNNLQNMFPSIDVDIVDLSQESIEGIECIYDPNTLTEKIDEFTSKHSKSAVLFDRIDYLLSNFSFEEVMNAIYKINDIIARNNAILLLRLNPLVLER